MFPQLAVGSQKEAELSFVEMGGATVHVCQSPEIKCCGRVYIARLTADVTIA